ncbi:MAG: hypothetical protein FJ404_00130 [Verrucomicrobia bacterium]|nr:hypothetical protein [Verrucomicrobiota bacterium]
MSKLVAVLLLALLFEAVGVVFLSKGLKAAGPPVAMTMPELARWIGRLATHPSILLGVALETVFFLGLLYLLSEADVSVVWPLTALGFVLTTLSAKFLLGEHVSAVRWAGVLLIVLGAGLITWSERRGQVPAPARWAQVTGLAGSVSQPLSDASPTASLSLPQEAHGKAVESKGNDGRDASGGSR